MTHRPSTTGTRRTTRVISAVACGCFGGGFLFLGGLFYTIEPYSKGVLVRKFAPPPPENHPSVVENARLFFGVYFGGQAIYSLFSSLVLVRE